MVRYSIPPKPCERSKAILTSSGYLSKIATGFVAHGSKVYITSRDKSACDETATELNKLGPGSCVAIPADLSKLSECERLVAELNKREKSMSVLLLIRSRHFLIRESHRATRLGQ